MFNFTPQIKTPSDKKTITLLVRSSVYVLFCATCLIAIKYIIFPTQIFNFDASIDSLANTISRPYESNRGTTVHFSTIGESNRLEISIELPEDEPALPENTNLLIKKSHNSFLSPVSEEKYTAHQTETLSTDDVIYLKKDSLLFPLVSESALQSYLFNQNLNNLPSEQISQEEKGTTAIGFASATLISSRDGIFVIEGRSRHPIQDERTFIGLGYNFNNVIETDSQERSAHKKARMLSITSDHPFGTIFFATDTGRSYIYDQKKLHKIITTPQSKQHGIPVLEKSRTSVASCTLEKGFSPNTYNCTASIEKISNFPGVTYQIILNDTPNTKIKKMKTKLFTTVNKKSLLDRINVIQTELQKTQL